MLSDFDLLLFCFNTPDAAPITLSTELSLTESIALLI